MACKLVFNALPPSIAINESCGGLAIALRLAKDGYSVCINDIAANRSGIDDAVKEIESLGRKAIGIVADVVKPDEVDSMIEETIKALGPLNLMVANAGIAQVKPLLEVTQEDFTTMFDVNVRGVFNCYTSAARKMIQQGNGGKIVGAARYFTVVELLEALI